MAEIERARIAITGAVQGVGFRPFIYRLAAETGVNGWVNNSAQGVMIEAEAEPTRLRRFMAQIDSHKPPHAMIHTLHSEFLPPFGYTIFEIHHSDPGGAKTAIVLPDLATCPECLAEMLDPTNRRYRYPFTNCTHCGPRFTIVEGLPYDRPNTTMGDFVMCDECRAEYENPLDRRFHAQPTACPTCGPQLALWDREGSTLADRDEALMRAADAIRQGKILAVKGLGGFHLMADARNTEAVARLRERKGRAEKPLAVMYLSLADVQQDCEVSALEAGLLTASEAPIVLLRYQGNMIAPDVAPGNPYLGVMLPYTPLHHLLLRELGFPVVATSGNLSGEPICIDEYEALERLNKIADLFLVHNRPIARHVDDSIVRVAAGRALILRRARGYAPMPVEIQMQSSVTDNFSPDVSQLPVLIAAGAHLKNTAAVLAGGQCFISQHIGDMDTPEAYEAYQRVIQNFQALYHLTPSAIACDLHPDYRSTQYAEATGLPLIRVQHHYAHVLSCMADNHLDAPVLGVSWDGTGYGTDGTIWGGELLRINAQGFERSAHLMTFPLPGGEQAVREPRRCALGLLYAVYGDDLPEDLPVLAQFTAAELKLLKSALRRGLNAPLTSSAGRLFDAVAGLIGLRGCASFEGQAAMELEFAQAHLKKDKCYPFDITEVTGDDGTSERIIDLKLTTQAIVEDVREGTPAGEIAAAFHNTLAAMIVSAAQRIGEEKVVLTGGCFQNKTLLEHTIDRLHSEGFQPYWSRMIPPNDGGIALGQVMAALRDRN